MRPILFAAALLMLPPALPAAAQETPMTERTERIGLEGRRGPRLTQPGFAVGEYTGHVAARGSAMRLPWASRDRAAADVSIASPGLGEVTGACDGGQSHRSILGIQFDTEDLAYVCRYEGGPADAAMSLVLSRPGGLGGLMRRVQQPQRVAEMTWNGVVYRAETRRIGGLPIGGGMVMGYVISRDDREVGGLDMNGFRPTFYLPRAGDADRDAVAVFALSLWAFPDPARN